MTVESIKTGDNNHELDQGVAGRFALWQVEARFIVPPSMNAMEQPVYDVTPSTLSLMSLIAAGGPNNDFQPRAITDEADQAEKQ